MFAAETFGVTPDVLCIGQGDERRLRAALGDDLPPADRRRLLGADRREPRLRRGAHLRGQPDLLRRRASPCCARSSSATCAATPARRATGCGPASRSWPTSTASSATSAARGCSRAIEFVTRPGDQGALPGRRRLRRQRRPPGAGERPALPLRPALDRLRPAAGRRRPSRSTRWWRCWTGAWAKCWTKLQQECEARCYETRRGTTEILLLQQAHSPSWSA